MQHDQKQPFNIYGIGRNYPQHITELQNERPTEPVVFLKVSSCLRGLEPSPVAFASETFAYEAEIVVKMTRNFALGEDVQWSDVTLFALGVDLTRREVQSTLKGKGLPWTLAKSFLGSALVGSFVAIEDEAIKKSIGFEFLLNGVKKQEATVSEMIWSIPQLLSYLNSFSPLKKDDLIYTGTPHGVGPINVGDCFEFVSAQLGRYQGQL